uniref:Uncharacterized protein n=1 Tax=Oryza meridionalis TaxID=40149 RepID=A0A0E0EDL3_9ORYZ
MRCGGRAAGRPCRRRRGGRAAGGVTGDAGRPGWPLVGGEVAAERWLRRGCHWAWRRGRLPCGWLGVHCVWELLAFRHGGGVGQHTRKTQVTKTRLFPFRSRRLDSTWRSTGGVAEGAWVSVQGSGARVEGAGGGVVFFVVGQANPVWGAPLLLCGELLCRLEAVVSLQGKLRLPRQCCSLSGLPWVGFDREAGGWRGRMAEAAWVSALAKVMGAVVVLSLAGWEVGRWRGVGRVWRKPCAADVYWWFRIGRQTMAVRGSERKLSPISLGQQ